MSRHAGKRFVAIFSAALLAGAMAMAQQGQPGMGGTSPGQSPMPGQPQEPGQTPNTPGYPGANPGQGPESAQGSMSRSFADQEFLNKTFSDSAAEAQMSQLAAQKSPSNDIKQYGQKMIQIHSQLDKQLQPVAQMLGVKPDNKPSRSQKKEIQQLKSLSGPAFDQAYIKAMAKDQKHDVKSFKEEETAAQSPTIKKAAQMDEPVLSQHLQILQQLAQNHNVTVASR
jgi:putative membrane protein